MSESRRVEAFIEHTRLREQSLSAPKELPGWAMIALGVLRVVFLLFLVSHNHPTLYGFAACMVVAAVADRAFDGLGASWGGGLLVVDVEPSRLSFQRQGGGVAIASIFLGAVIGASFFFVGAMVTPGLDLNRYFTAFGLILAFGCWHGVRRLWRAAHGVELRLDAEGIAALRVGRRKTTVPGGSVLGAYSERQRLILMTTSGTIGWPAQQFQSDPVVIAEVIGQFCASERSGADFAVAIVDELAAPSRPTT